MADTIGSRIRAAREAKGLTQGQLARAVDAPDARTVWRWESGKSTPSVDMLTKLADALTCRIETLIAPISPGHTPVSETTADNSTPKTAS